MYKALSAAYFIGMILVLAGILFQLNDIPYALVCLIIGLIPILGGRLFNFIKGKAENKRLHAIMLFSALFLTAAVVAIYFNRSYWIIAVLITATLDLYVSFRKYKR
ncbi:hypothetical protein SAMN06265379_10496 [Saccharicrinis carchari]|uniref:DUF2568 domain-containing protein n=1 Tax=Saccharicrinis carchari TaxID=1168039 RepID=A0A521D136_SACCC|nr:hypothetical protein [Saccharicrinis carchari]SMO65372.1 hypothetical protein SAMN06265379_10496 [Saccharicrinis carchari]